MEFNAVSNVALAILALSVTAVIFGVTKFVEAYRNLPGERLHRVRRSTSGRQLLLEAMATRRELERAVVAGSHEEVQKKLRAHYPSHGALVVWMHEEGLGGHTEDDEYLFALGRMNSGGTLPPYPYEQGGRYAPPNECSFE